MEQSNIFQLLKSESERGDDAKESKYCDNSVKSPLSKFEVQYQIQNDIKAKKIVPGIVDCQIMIVAPCDPTCDEQTKWYKLMLVYLSPANQAVVTKL